MIAKQMAGVLYNVEEETIVQIKKVGKKLLSMKRNVMS